MKQSLLPLARRLLGPAFVVAAVLLGGSSSGGLEANLALQLVAVAICAWSLWASAAVPWTLSQKQLVWLGLAFTALALLHLVPLPPELWTALPGRAAIARGFALLGAPLPWLPVSLDPAGTLAALVPAILALAALQVVRLTDDKDLPLLVWSVPAMAGASILLGIAQVTSGQDSPLYVYALTNRGNPVGFFANSNHLATLMVASLPFLAALARGRIRRMKPQERIPQFLALGALALFLLLGAVVAGSVAGLALLLPSLAGAALILSGRARSPLAVGGLFAGLAAMAGFMVVGAQSPWLSGFGITSIGDGPTGRASIYATTVDAIRTYFPVGSGLGSFVHAYPAFEDAARAGPVFANHAHSDYLELAMELGLPGVLLILALLAWWVRRSLEIWLGRQDLPFARAASVASGLILAHSLVDYPLRTGAMLVVFTLCLALMARPAAPPAAATTARPKARHLSVV